MAMWSPHTWRGTGSVYILLPDMTGRSTDKTASVVTLKGGLLGMTRRTQSLEYLLSTLTYGVERGDMVPLEVAVEC